ncbi:MAG: hypothetical protein O3A63_01750 [Proteobacteria bacterium]|nr:hypothetical protein [Pseudomonadota bacterium]
MRTRFDKPLRPLTELDAQGHLGVFELADENGQVLFIGYAGGKSLFGLKGEIQAASKRLSAATHFRYEINTAYWTRYQELLMLHKADHGELPAAVEFTGKLGRLSPG